MKKAKGRAASIAWTKARRQVTGREFQAAYAERRLELEVAAMICALRRKRGVSQQELADLLGTKQSAIARLEGGAENITVTRLQKIAGALGAQVKIDLDPLSI